jgi:hypothetical protein
VPVPSRADRWISRAAGTTVAGLAGIAGALAIGTTASLAANVATADAGAISRIIAGWPALALLIAVKLLSGILEYRAAGTVPAPSPSGPR